MTTLTAEQRVPVARRLGRSCAAEWTRLWTVHSTGWLLAAAALVMIGLGAIAGNDAAGEADGDAAWLAAEFTSMPAQFALLALAILVVTSDYTTGGIVPTLQWTPRRSILFLARTAVVVGTATVVGVALGTAASVAAFTMAQSSLTLPLDEGVEVLTSVGLVFASGTALAAGLGFLLRSTAGGLVSVFLLWLVLPVLLPQFGYSWLTSAADALPGTSALYLLLGEPEGRGITETSARLTMLAWAGGALLLGWLRLIRTDANR